MFKEIIINFIVDLSLSKKAYYIYNSLIVVLENHTKVIRYLLILKKLIIIELKKILYSKVFLKYR